LVYLITQPPIFFLVYAILPFDLARLRVLHVLFLSLPLVLLAELIVLLLQLLDLLVQAHFYVVLFLNVVLQVLELNLQALVLGLDINELFQVLLEGVVLVVELTDFVIYFGHLN
jgi:hypothetical protein